MTADFNDPHECPKVGKIHDTLESIEVQLTEITFMLKGASGMPGLVQQVTEVKKEMAEARPTIEMMKEMKILLRGYIIKMIFATIVIGIAMGTAMTAVIKHMKVIGG